MEEIIHNKDSTLNEKLFLKHKEEAMLKVECRPEEYWTLNEMLALKLYTGVTMQYLFVRF